MRITPVLALGLLPLVAGCQWLPFDTVESSPTPVRLQGELSRAGEMLLMVPCGEQRRLLLIDAAQLGLEKIAPQLQAQSSQPLFADLGGELDGDADGLYAVNQLYRLQAEGPGCADPAFKKSIVRAGGHEPEWSVSVSARGMVLERPDSAPLALPYVEENLPDGSLSFSSEANGQRIELWLTPTRCQDGMSGAISHLQARLMLNREAPLAGCAALGGARN